MELVDSSDLFTIEIRLTVVIAEEMEVSLFCRDIGLTKTVGRAYLNWENSIVRFVRRIKKKLVVNNGRAEIVHLLPGRCDIFKKSSSAYLTTPIIFLIGLFTRMKKIPAITEIYATLRKSSSTGKVSNVPPSRPAMRLPRAVPINHTPII